MFLRLELDNSSSVPLYRQVYGQLSSAIRTGSLPSGSRLPATRELASQYGLNRTTVSSAYALLEADGLIRGHVGRGSFVCFDGPAEASAARSPEEIIGFASSKPAPEQFPMADFQRTCLEVVTGRDVAELLQLGSPAGYLPLRRYLSSKAAAEGTLGDGGDVVVTNGCQQAIDLLQRVLAPAGSSVVVEDPVYHGLRNVFERAGVRLVGVPMTSEGIDLDRLERTLAAVQPRLLILTPDFQNPTGWTLPLSARRRIVSMVRDSGVILVENDIYGDLRYEGDSLPGLRQLDPGGQIILLRSFSKMAFPGLRVGWMIGPSAILASVAEARQWCDLHTDHLSQAILLRFAESGRLTAHMERVVECGRERLRAVLGACGRHLPSGSTFTRPQGGMNLWVSLPPGLDSAALLTRAQQAGVTYLPGKNFTVARHDPGALRLSFGALSPERIEEGIAVLGRLFTEEAERTIMPSRCDAAPALV